MTLQEYILQEKATLDQFALDNRLREAQPDIQDWHNLFYAWSILKEQAREDVSHYPHSHD